MIKCSKGCTPTCQHCVYAKHEEIEFDGCVFDGEAEACRLHSDQGVDATYWCSDFHCFRAPLKLEHLLDTVGNHL